MNNTTDTLNQWLQEISSASDTPLSLDQSHRCFIGTNNNVDLMVCGAPLCENFSVFLHICDMKDITDIEVFQALLALNLKPAYTCGGALAYDEGKQSLILTFSHEYQGLTAREFGNMLENLSQAVPPLQEYVNTLFDDASTSIQEQTAPNPLQMLRI
ncbi:CesT family type III secretion system chaperone [Thalassomonas sp. RHCl1]|uniref:CesT family type III secretion system chaperone n=1 Tax=Thalassomonas sp. RHCl1 TaxID=2995320 RepID=UPI00248BA900|nr:CesT family type III secretion system chaperone [Thalassomonas sp. RHCl1]